MGSLVAQLTKAPAVWGEKRRAGIYVFGEGKREAGYEARRNVSSKACGSVKDVW